MMGWFKPKGAKKTHHFKGWRSVCSRHRLSLLEWVRNKPLENAGEKPCRACLRVAAERDKLSKQLMSASPAAPFAAVGSAGSVLNSIAVSPILANCPSTDLDIRDEVDDRIEEIEAHYPGQDLAFESAMWAEVKALIRELAGRVLK